MFIGGSHVETSINSIHRQLCAHTNSYTVIHMGHWMNQNISIPMRRNAIAQSYTQSRLYLSRLHCIFVDCLSTVPCSEHSLQSTLWPYVAMWITSQIYCSCAFVWMLTINQQYYFMFAVCMRVYACVCVCVRVVKSIRLARSNLISVIFILCVLHIFYFFFFFSSLLSWLALHTWFCQYFFFFFCVWKF